MRGFTLIELLVALVIVSIVLFYMLPKTLNFYVKTDKNLNQLDKAVLLAKRIAEASGEAQGVCGEKGSNTLFVNDQQFKLKSEIFNVKVNENYADGLEYCFYVYPQGVMDRVTLKLSNGESLISKPLLLRFTVAK